MAQPSAYEQYLLELVNAARANPATTASSLGIGLNDGLPAGTISSAAKAPLAFNPNLISAAQQHSAWMLANNTFSHTGADGSSPGDRMVASGYAFIGSWSWGENIAINYGPGTSVSLATIQSLENGLFKSAGHRQNLLNPGFREIGVGIASGAYQGTAAVDVTQDFAQSGSSSFLTGVAYNDQSGDNFYEPGEGLGGVAVLVKSSTGAIWQTTTWASGGYQIALAAGNYTATFSGGGLTKAVTKSFTIGSANVAVDLNSRVDAAGGTTSPPPPSVILGTGNDTLALSISEDAWNGDAQFTIGVDGKPIGGTQTANASHAAGQSQEFDVKGTFGAGMHTATVTFLNDAWGGTPATDRNLYLSGAKIDGTAIPGATLTENTAGPKSFAFQIGSGSANSATLAAFASNAMGDATPRAAVADARFSAAMFSDLAQHQPGIAHLCGDSRTGADQGVQATMPQGGLGFLTDAPGPLLNPLHPFLP